MDPKHSHEQVEPEKVSSEDDKHDGPRNESFSSAQAAADYERKKANALLANPLRGYTHAELGKMGKAYALSHALVEPEDFRAFEIGAKLAQNPKSYETVEGLTEEEKVTLQREFTNKWSQPKLLYLVIVLCSTCAAVQGMGEFSLGPARLFSLPQAYNTSPRAINLLCIGWRIRNANES